MDKFKFTIEFQEGIIGFILKDPKGSQILNLINDHYFQLLSHSFIIQVLKSYFNEMGRVPGRISLDNEINSAKVSKKYRDLITPEFFKEVTTIIDTIYNKPVVDGDNIVSKIEIFIKFVELKKAIEDVDITDYDVYPEFLKQVKKAISPKIIDESQRGIFIVKDVIKRQMMRKTNPNIVPTPFKQLNLLTNAGGYTKGSLAVILDKPKRFKSGALINLARGYMRMSKNILYIDLENGEMEIASRLDQSLLKVSKLDLIDSTSKQDKDFTKKIRRYKVLNSECIVRRMPAGSTTITDIDNFMDDLYNDEGIIINVLIIDYLGKMASLKRTDSEYQSISEACIDISNLALKRDLDIAWTAMHVQRQAEVREGTKYLGTDVAKSIDIVRSAQVIIGQQRTQEEDDNNTVRWEIIEQRDGPPYGRAVFHVDHDKQTLVEYSPEERARFDEIFTQEKPNNTKPTQNKNLKGQGDFGDE